MPERLFNSASPRASELPAAPPRPASEQSPQYSRVIIPGDDPGDQQPTKSTPVSVINVNRPLAALHGFRVPTVNYHCLFINHNTI